MKYSFVYITTGSRKEASRIGRTVVTERLAACANILDKMSSFYWWEGKVQKDNEAVLILKTREKLVHALIRRIKKLHSYKVPCIVALPIIKGNPDFLEWIRKETKLKVH